MVSTMLHQIFKGRDNYPRIRWELCLLTIKVSCLRTEMEIERGYRAADHTVIDPAWGFGLGRFYLGSTV